MINYHSPVSLLATSTLDETNSPSDSLFTVHGIILVMLSISLSQSSLKRMTAVFNHDNVVSKDNGYFLCFNHVLRHLSQMVEVQEVIDFIFLDLIAYLCKTNTLLSDFQPN